MNQRKASHQRRRANTPEMPMISQMADCPPPRSRPSCGFSVTLTRHPPGAGRHEGHRPRLTNQHAIRAKGSHRRRTKTPEGQRPRCHYTDGTISPKARPPVEGRREHQRGQFLRVPNDRDHPQELAVSPNRGGDKQAPLISGIRTSSTMCGVSRRLDYGTF